MNVELCQPTPLESHPVGANEDPVNLPDTAVATSSSADIFVPVKLPCFSEGSSSSNGPKALEIFLPKALVEPKRQFRSLFGDLYEFTDLEVAEQRIEREFNKIQEKLKLLELLMVKLKNSPTADYHKMFIDSLSKIRDYGFSQDFRISTLYVDELDGSCLKETVEEIRIFRHHILETQVKTKLRQESAPTDFHDNLVDVYEQLLQKFENDFLEDLHNIAVAEDEESAKASSYTDLLSSAEALDFAEVSQFISDFKELSQKFSFLHGKIQQGFGDLRRCKELLNSQLVVDNILKQNQKLFAKLAVGERTLAVKEVKFYKQQILEFKHLNEQILTSLRKFLNDNPEKIDLLKIFYVNPILSKSTGGVKNLTSKTIMPKRFVFYKWFKNSALRTNPLCVMEGDLAFLEHKQQEIANFKQRFANLGLEYESHKDFYEDRTIPLKAYSRFVENTRDQITKVMRQFVEYIQEQEYLRDPLAFIQKKSAALSQIFTTDCPVTQQLQNILSERTFFQEILDMRFILYEMHIHHEIMQILTNKHHQSRISLSSLPPALQRLVDKEKSAEYLKDVQEFLKSVHEGVLGFSNGLMELVKFSNVLLADIEKDLHKQERLVVQARQAVLLEEEDAERCAKARPKAVAKNLNKKSLEVKPVPINLEPSREVLLPKKAKYKAPSPLAGSSRAEEASALKATRPLTNPDEYGDGDVTSSSGLTQSGSLEFQMAATFRTPLESRAISNLTTSSSAVTSALALPRAERQAASSLVQGLASLPSFESNFNLAEWEVVPNPRYPDPRPGEDGWCSRMVIWRKRV